MGKKLSPNDLKLYQRCDEVLHYIWDPIGVAAIPEARDEYHSYIPGAFERLQNGAEAKEIADYLVEIETSKMEMTPNRARATNAAQALIDWRECIREGVR